MNVSSIKSLVWLATLGVGAALGYSVYQFQFDAKSPRHRTHLSTSRVTLADQEAALEVPKPPAPKVDRVAYERVQGVFHSLNWTGKEAPPPPPPPVDAGPAKPVHKPAKDLLKVLYLQVDSSAPEMSRASVRYTLPELSTRVTSPTGQVTLREGDHLPEPQATLRVDRIAEEGVYFVREGAGEGGADGEPQLVSPPSPFTQGIVMVGPDGALMPVQTIIPQAIGSFSREQRRYTTSIGDDHYVGTEDAQYIEENYLDILSREVRHRRWRDPRNGQLSGIEITSVAPNSIPAKFGLAEGDIVIKVNDQPVSSVNEAIDYAKNNADQYDTWTVTLLSKGKEKVITVNEP